MVGTESGGVKNRIGRVVDDEYCYFFFFFQAEDGIRDRDG